MTDLITLIRRVKATLDGRTSQAFKEAVFIDLMGLVAADITERSPRIAEAQITIVSGTSEYDLSANAIGVSHVQRGEDEQPLRPVSIWDNRFNELCGYAVRGLDDATADKRIVFTPNALELLYAGEVVTVGEKFAHVATTDTFTIPPSLYSVATKGLTFYIYQHRLTEVAAQIQADTSYRWLEKRVATLSEEYMTALDRINRGPAVAHVSVFSRFEG